MKLITTVTMMLAFSLMITSASSVNFLGKMNRGDYFYAFNVSDIDCGSGSGSCVCSDVYVNESGDTMTGSLTIDGSANEVQLDISGHSTQTTDFMQITDSSSNECWAFRQNNNIIINPSGNCIGASTTGNYIRMYAPDAGFTGNYLLLESNSGNDIMSITYQGYLQYPLMRVYATTTNFATVASTPNYGASYSISNGDGYGAIFVSIDKGSFEEFEMVSGASKVISMFGGSTEGETQTYRLYGFRTGDQLRSMNMTVGADQDDSVTIDGLSTYIFDGNVSADDYLYNSEGFKGDALTQIKNMRNEDALKDGWSKVDHTSYGDSWIRETVQQPITEKYEEYVCEDNITYCEDDDINGKVCREEEGLCFIDTLTNVTGYEEVVKDKISLVRLVALQTRAIQQLTERVEYLEGLIK